MVRGHGVLVGLLVASLALAGCSGSDDGDGTATSATDTSTAGSASATTTARSSTGTTTSASSTTTAASNRAPTGTVSVTVNGTQAVFALNGTDADGDGVTWVLAFGDGSNETGTSLPATVDHSYAAAGNYSAQLTLEDGQATAVLNVSVLATAATAGGSQTATGSWLQGNVMVGCFADTAFGMPNYPAELDGVLYASFAIDALTYGLPVKIAISSAAVADSPGFTFLDADGGILATGFMSDPPKTVPEGAATGVFWVCAGGPMEGTYTAA